MNLIRSGMYSSAPSAQDDRSPVNIYHLHPLVAGPLSAWAPVFARIAAMGFSHVCLAPPFEPGGSGDIFVHSTFARLHPALEFAGTADQGLSVMSELTTESGLGLMLDIAPGQVAVDSALRQQEPDWFAPNGSDQIADPRRPPRRVDVAVPRFGQTALADAESDW